LKDPCLLLYTTADLAKAKPFFRALIGADPYADSAYYVGFKSGDTEIGLAPGAGKHGPGALAYWDVDDIGASIKTLVGAGGTVAQEPTDVANGLLVAAVQDPNGAMIGLRQAPKG
jgi:predicted enzyme related to lactoylglutathione lyase